MDRLTRPEELIVEFVRDHRKQWDQDNWDAFRRQVACFQFGLETGKNRILDILAAREK